MTVNHNAKPGADGRHWQSWHLRFRCYQERMVRMAEHLRTEEVQTAVARMRLEPRFSAEARVGRKLTGMKADWFGMECLAAFDHWRRQQPLG